MDAKQLEWYFACAAFAGYMLYNAWRIWRGARGRSWPTVEGEIVESGYKPTTYRQRMWLATIRYRYSAKGRKRDGRLRILLMSEEKADRVLEKYPQGAEVEVHVSPTDPDQSILDPQVRPSNVWAFAGCLALLMVMLATRRYL